MPIYLIDHFAFQNIGFYRYATSLIKGCLSRKLVFTQTSNPWREKKANLEVTSWPGLPVMLQVPEEALEPQQVHVGQCKTLRQLIYIEGNQAFMN